MEEIRDFSAELATLLDTRSRISSTKIQNIGRLGVQHIRNYKLVVHAVERFLAKCPPECKLAGLYVIDGVVRRSQAKYGAKDVFTPRFSKNMATTIENVLRCPAADRDRVRKVVDLWAHNAVFPEDVIQSIETMGSGYLPAPRSPGYYKVNKAPAGPAEAGSTKSLVDDFDYGDEDVDATPQPQSVGGTPAQLQGQLMPVGVPVPQLPVQNSIAVSNPIDASAIQSQIQHLQALLALNGVPQPHPPPLSQQQQQQQQQQHHPQPPVGAYGNPYAADHPGFPYHPSQQYDHPSHISHGPPIHAQGQQQPGGPPAPHAGGPPYGAPGNAPAGPPHASQPPPHGGY
eukprot:Opistho-2@32417